MAFAVAPSLSIGKSVSPFTDRRRLRPCFHVCPCASADPPPKTPGAFPLSYYRPRTLSVTADSFVVRVQDNKEIDHVHAEADGRVLVLVDFGGAPGALALVRALVREANAFDASGTHGPVRSLHCILRSLLRRSPAPASAAVLLATVSPHGVLRVATVGSCGLLVVRDQSVEFRSYGQVEARDALESLLASNTPARAAADNMVSDFFELHDDDLVVAGSDGLFANISEQQILAFVRPVPDPLDPVLSMANNTCLGSFTHDDPTFIASNLAHLAHNFSDAQHCAPLLAFPFPPSPHSDDVSVIVAALELL